MKRTLVAATALSLAITLASCGDNDEDPAPSPSPSADASSTTTSPSVPTTSTSEAGGPPADWEANLTRIELEAAQSAMQSWEEFRPLLDDIYKKGQLTPGAKSTLQKYDFWWQRDIVDLGETYEKGGLRLEAGVEPIWSYASSVKLSPDGTGEVVITQCTYYEPLSYSRDGKVLDIKKPKHLITPLEITMTKPDGKHGWMHYETKLKDKTSCVE